MPIYEYQCGSCDHKMEALQKMADAPLTDCPSCGKSTLTKLVSAAAFKLKGSGWYETDFKNANKPANNDSGGNANKESSSASSDGAKSTSTKESSTKKSSGSSASSSSTAKASN